jgi:hypothetical protein
MRVGNLQMALMGICSGARDFRVRVICRSRGCNGWRRQSAVSSGTVLGRRLVVASNGSVGVLATGIGLIKRYLLIARVTANLKIHMDGFIERAEHSAGLHGWWERASDKAPMLSGRLAGGNPCGR